jgi:hypothetical protein
MNMQRCDSFRKLSRLSATQPLDLRGRAEESLDAVRA